MHAPMAPPHFQGSVGGGTSSAQRTSLLLCKSHRNWAFFNTPTRCETSQAGPEVPEPFFRRRLPFLQTSLPALLADFGGVPSTRAFKGPPRGRGLQGPPGASRGPPGASKGPPGASPQFSGPDFGGFPCLKALTRRFAAARGQDPPGGPS